MSVPEHNLNVNSALKAPVFIDCNPSLDNLEKGSESIKVLESKSTIETFDIEISSNENFKPNFNQVYPILHELFMSGDMENTQKILIRESKIFIKSVLVGSPTFSSTFYFIALCIDIILRGVSQVFLCNHPISGVFILLGLSLSHINYVLYAILGTILSTLSFFLFSHQLKHIFAGLAGYDGALVGCACYHFLDAKFSFGATVLLSFLVGIIHLFCVNFLGTWKLPAFTLGFNIVTMLTLLAIKGDIISWQTQLSPIIYENEFINETWSYFIDTTFRGVGQFMFAHTTLGSFFVILGIAISSRLGAFAAMGGSIVGKIYISFLILYHFIS